jgi:hypothetical protein
VSTNVSDVRSNPQDQIAHAARVIGKSRQRRKVFAAIYKGQKRFKTVDELIEATGLNQIRVLQEGGKLAGNFLVIPIKVKGRTAYKKDSFYSLHKKEILRLAGDKAALNEFPTKSNPRQTTVRLVLPLPSKSFQVSQITIDDLLSFQKVKSIITTTPPKPVRELPFKNGIKNIMGEEGKFQDWGGEPDDLFTTRLLIGTKRVAAAFGFKGRGTTGILTPKKMGKRGDQLQRLFSSPASAFFVQYWGQIDESILEQMQRFATAKSALEGKKIYFGIIDGTDTQRLIAAYPEYFQGAI